MWWPLQQQINGLVPFVCESGWGCSPRCRWKSSPHCTPNRWWRDAGTGCCPGRWWTGAACELHCSCSGCWMHSACDSSVRILQGAACIIIPARERQDDTSKSEFLFHSLWKPHHHIWALVWRVQTASLRSGHRRPELGTSVRWAHEDESGNLQRWLQLKVAKGEWGHSGWYNTIYWHGGLKVVNNLVQGYDTHRAAACLPESTTSTRSPSWMSPALLTSCRMLLVEVSCLNNKILS